MQGKISVGNMTETLIEDLTLDSPDDTETLNRVYRVCDEIIQNALYELGYSETDSIKPLHWNYCISKVQEKVFKANYHILHINPAYRDEYSIEKVLAIYRVYKDLSYKYSQEITLTRFTYFTGIERQTLYTWSSKESNKAKPGRNDVLQTIRLDSEESLSNMLSDKSINALGTIAKLNHYHGWREDNKTGNSININFSDSPMNITSRYNARLTENAGSDHDGNG